MDSIPCFWQLLVVDGYTVGCSLANSACVPTARNYLGRSMEQPTAACMQQQRATDPAALLRRRVPWIKVPLQFISSGVKE
jgi:hypothetical protein